MDFPLGRTLEISQIYGVLKAVLFLCVAWPATTWGERGDFSYFPLSRETIQLKADFMQRATQLQLEGEAERTDRLKFL
eukprot:SAG31_NODE_8308_length_1477_cov_1.172714_1_plen_78_part_00